MNYSPLSGAVTTAVSQPLSACLTFNPSPHHLLLCPFLSLPVCLPSGLTILSVLCDRRDAAVRGINEAAADVCNLGNCSLT